VKRIDIIRLVDEGYDDDEIEQMLAEDRQRDSRERKQKKQEKDTWRRRPSKEAD
jgi:hypothetical protein